MNAVYKREILDQIAQALRTAPEVRKVVVFGSFLSSDSPNDIDVAVFQESNEDYLPLALKYRRLTKPISTRLPMDIIPIKPDAKGEFVEEINKGQVIYER
jgi:predicted nucleotidyltransferase